MKKTSTLTIIALLLAAIVPAAIFTYGFAIVGNGFSDSISNQLLYGSNPIERFIKEVGAWGLFCLCFPFPVALIHLAVLGVPAFIVGRNSRRINWLSVLTVSFFIGGIPWAFLGALSAPANHGVWEMIQWASVFGAVMGLLGSSGGMTFLVLWRYWLLPMWTSEESLLSTQES